MAPAQSLIAALEAGGDQLLLADKVKIEAVADGIADDLLNKAATAFANNLPSGGLRSLEFGPVKSALLASIPQLDAATNEQIDKLFEMLAGAAANAQPAP
ncbi:MAG: hypothetical protein ACYC8W_10860 [Candidatus Tyrphobacter sp.]